MAPLTKDIVRDAVSRGKGLITTWPESFATIAEADRYVSDTLEYKRFRYGCMADAPKAVRREVASRTQHTIATEAHKAGKFKLVRAPPKNGALWNAIQMGIKQTEPAIPWYQDSFENINASRAWVKTMCKGKCIEYKPFQGVNAEQMETYAHYHTARRAYEAGYFSLDEKPEKPYRAKTTIIPSLPKKGSENSNRVHSTPSRNLEKPVVAAGSPKPNDTTLEKSAGTEEKSHRIMNTEKADTNLIDLDEPSKAGGNPSNAEVQLIDLAGTAVGGIGALIDLSMPEEQPKLPSDMLDMVDLFAGESSPVKDETFNELAAEIQLGKMIL